ncbi:MAG: sulfite exporter TauE/SafE family protein [Actinobacteria bacterium]|nr:sulfite exporter TauE/SafE family protein [Actinomycetota bacterium]
MVTTEKALRVILGKGAVAHPRRAALAAGVLLILGLSGWGVAAILGRGAGPPNAAPAVSGAEVTRLLSRSGYGPGGSQVQVVFATPEYFRWTAQPGQAGTYDVENNLVFLVWENIHDGDLAAPMQPGLRIDGALTYLPGEVLVPANAVHHRFSVVLYPRHDRAGTPVIGPGTRSLELVLPPAHEEGAASILSWSLPIPFPGEAQEGGFEVTGASILALFGGVLASMWPCLFQLTAYFIPTLAGVSMSQGRAEGSVRVVRLRVAKTAGLFILGFVIVYTAAGAAAGYAAQSLDGSSLFWSIRRPLSILAGLVLLFMAARLAASARAPLVCKMPVVSSLGRKKTGPFGTMLLGVAFAAGCTTCFGAALILGMVTYVGIAGTPALGALLMFVFSLGMAIPLLAGAMAMARVLTALGRLERVARGMVLASSVIMAGFAVLLLSGRFMWLSNTFGRAIGGGTP